MRDYKYIFPNQKGTEQECMLTNKLFEIIRVWSMQPKTNWQYGIAP